MFDAAQVCVRSSGKVHRSEWRSGALSSRLSGRMQWTCASKLIVALTAGALVDRSAMAFDTPIGDLDDRFSGSPFAAIPVGDLLSHRSGVVGDPAAGACLDDTDRRLEQLFAKATVHEPGVAVSYSTWTNSFVLGAVIEAVTDRRYDEVAEALVLGPVGACRTTVSFADAFGPDVEALRDRASGEPLLDAYRNCGTAPGVSACGPMDEVVLLLASLTDAGPAVVSAQTRATMLRPREARGPDLVTGSELRWGLGLVVDGRAFGPHLPAAAFGVLGFGASTVAYVDPTSATTVAFSFDTVLADPMGLLRQAAFAKAAADDASSSSSW